MDWFLLAMVDVVAYSISNILQRVLMKDQKSDAVAYAIVFQLLCGLLIGIAALLRGFVMPPIAQMPVNFIIMTLLFGFSMVFTFKALKIVQASEMTIISSTATLWTIVAALLFLGESLDINKLVGILLMLGGIVVVFWRKTGLKINKGFIYALLASFFFGLAVANDAFILRQAELFSYYTIGFLLPGLFILVLNLKSLPEIKKLLLSKSLPKMVISAIFYSIAAVAMLMAFQQGGNISQLAPITKFSIILTVLLAAVFLGEKDNFKRKTIAAIMAIIGVFLIK